MIRKIGSLIALSIVLLSYSTAYAAPGTHHDPQSTSFSQEKQTWNLNDADIRTVIQQVSKQVKKNFVIDPRVKGKVSLISSHPLSPDETYQMFLSMLQVNGYSVVPQGSIIKIIPESEVRGAPTPVFSDLKNSESDQVVVQVIRVRNVPVKTLINALRSFMPRTGSAEMYEPTNDIIISASKANVTHMREIIERLDRPTDGNLEVIKLHNAAPVDMVSMLQSALTQDPASGRGPVSLAADERTNSIVVGGDLSQRLRLRAIVGELDVPSNNYGDTQVIYLKYIESKDVASIVANIIQQYVDEHKLTSTNPSSTSQNQQQAGGANNNSNNSFSSFSSSLKLGANSSGSGGSSLGSYGGSSSGGLGGSSGSGGDSSSFFSQDNSGPKSGSVGPYVQWEQTTNAVIIKAPPPIMHTVKSVIAKLDIRRPQVLVDVIIAEIDEQHSRELGVEWNSAGDIPIITRFPTIAAVSQTAAILTGTGTTTTDVATGTTTTGTATVLPAGVSPWAAAAGTGLTTGFINHGNLRGILRALSGDSTSNVLATPNIVTLDNEIANIKVGQLVSFSTGQTNNYNAGGVPFTSYSQEEVGLSLTIRPQITSAGTVKLKIESVLSNIVPGVTDAGGNPRTTERDISTNIMVDNGQILVLGGLLQKDWNSAVYKVPILGDIPLLGFLFRSHSKQKDKTNLMIFLRPTILRDSRASVIVSNDKYSNMRQEMVDSRLDVAQPYLDEPDTIPPLHGERRLPSPYPEREK